MKFNTALTLFAVLATSKLAYGQTEDVDNNDVDTADDGDNTVNIATEDTTGDNAAQTAEPYLPDIYWWTAIVPEDQITNYITEPLPTKDSNENSVASPEVTAASEAASSDAETPTAAASESEITSAPDASATSDSAIPTSESLLESGASSAASAISSAATDVSSAASSAWSSQYSSASSAPASFSSAYSQTISVAKPSSSGIPPASGTPPTNNPNAAYRTHSNVATVLFSVAISAVLATLFN